ncbi:hypothetical protein TNCV_3029361 [Trichonephila clavipes]|nr:hypothetical protein TNCV_3029361 [Trichonephila clavipes]
MGEKPDAGDQQTVKVVEEAEKTTERILVEPDEKVGGAMKKTDDVSVAFGGARPKIKPRNTFDDGGGVMEKTKSKKKRQRKDRKHERRDTADQQKVEVVKKAETIADTARGEMDEKPDAGDQQTVEEGPRRQKRMHKLKVEKWTRRLTPGTS